MANLVLNGKSIDNIADIAENFVEVDILRAFCNGSLSAWLEEYDYEEELERVRAIKPTASSIRVLAGISEALNLDDDVIAEAAARREEQRRKEEIARKAREEQQRRDEEERLRRERETQQLSEDNDQTNHEQPTQALPESTGGYYAGVSTFSGGHFINPEKCVGCGACKETCPADAISEVNGTYMIDTSLCVDCGACAAGCPAEAICYPAENPYNDDVKDFSASYDLSSASCYSNPALFDRVRNIIVEQLGVDYGLVTPDASFIDDLGADSLDSVELIMAFEEEFGAALPEEDVEKLTTVGEVVAYLQSKGY